MGDKSEQVCSKDGSLGDTLLPHLGEDGLEAVEESESNLQSDVAPRNSEDRQSGEKEENGGGALNESVEINSKKCSGILNSGILKESSKPQISCTGFQRLLKFASLPFLKLRKVLKNKEHDRAKLHQESSKVQTERTDSGKTNLSHRSRFSSNIEEAGHPAPTDEKKPDEGTRLYLHSASWPKKENVLGDILKSGCKKKRRRPSSSIAKSLYFKTLGTATSASRTLPRSNYHRKRRKRKRKKISKHALPAVDAKKTENLVENPTISQTQEVVVNIVKSLGGSQDVAEGFAERLEGCSTEEQLDVCLSSLQDQLWPHFQGTLTEWKDHVQSIRIKIQGKQRRERYLENVRKSAQTPEIIRLDDEL